MADGGDYVTIGTPFDIPEQDEPLPKPSKVEDQIVTDEKGRRRFHGAFTGGFSAGYFNTVGSKEGWAPSSFKSSRSKKSEDEQVKNIFSRPEDFMDDEDFAEHGIAPKKLKTTFQHSNAENVLDSQKKSLLRAINDEEVHSAIPGGGDPLVNLLAPPKHSVGIKLLQKMGWKPGQGIGEKIELSPEKEDIAVKKKIYGCALPPRSRVQSYDMNTFQMMLAPKDMQPITFNKKDNFHGIGYSGIITVQTQLRSTAVVDNDRSFRPTGKEKKGIRGQAFGVGAFEEEDDDIYGENSLSNYDMTMMDDNDDKHGWTGSMSKPKAYKDCLPGFVKSMKKLNRRIPPVTIQTPQNIPRHIFPDDVSKVENTQNVKIVDNDSSLKRTKLTSHERGDLLGEVTKSMQDVKHWTLKWDQGTSSKDENVSKKETLDKAIPVDVMKPKPSRWDKDTDPVRPRQDSKKSDDVSKSDIGTSNTNNGVFKPFSRYPEKQERYEVYLEAVKKGFKPDLKYDTSITEWEKEREIAEFARAATMYKPLTSSMASRFIRANFIDSEDATRSKDEDNKPDDKKAAEMGMFGKLTRTLLDWHPDPVLCKRMNIPNPYPSSKIKGVPSRNKKQTSFFSDSLLDDNKNITSNEQKSDEVEEEDEFFSRIQKNKQKLLKSKSGPLSHLNIKLDCNKTNDSEKSNLENVSSDMSNSEEKEIIVKPSIDIFKAIFENSDSENSDDNGEDGKKEELEGKSEANNSSVSLNNVTNLELKLNSECPSIINEQLLDSKSNSTISNVRNNVQLTSDKKSKFLPLAFLNRDQTKHNTPSTSENKLEKDNGITFYENKSNEKISVTQLEHNNEKGSANVDDSVDPSISKPDKSKHKKRKKEKKSKKSKKKNFSSENSDNETDSNHRKKKKKHSDDNCSDDDSDKYYKKKKKKKYKSDDSDNETNKRYKKKKSKRHRSSSSSSEGSVVPSNTLLLEKLKNLAQSSKRPTAADFM